MLCTKKHVNKLLRALEFLQLIGLSVVDSPITTIVSFRVPGSVWGATKLGNSQTAHHAATTTPIGSPVFILPPSGICRGIRKFGTPTIAGIVNWFCRKKV